MIPRVALMLDRQELNASNTPPFNLMTGFSPDQVFWRSGGTNTTTDSVLTDALGSTLATTTPAPTPAIRTSFTYEPHGKPNATTFPYLFTGRDYDATTGLQYNRSRTYAPAYGRFTSEDPIGILGGSVNPYLYAGNAPTVFTDPFGLEPGELAADFLQILLDLAVIALASLLLAGALTPAAFFAPLLTGALLTGGLLATDAMKGWLTLGSPGVSPSALSWMVVSPFAALGFGVVLVPFGVPLLAGAAAGAIAVGVADLLLDAWSLGRDLEDAF